MGKMEVTTYNFGYWNGFYVKGWNFEVKRECVNAEPTLKSRVLKIMFLKLKYYLVMLGGKPAKFHIPKLLYRKILIA